MGQALYRAYRPKKLSEVVGQEHVTTTLSNALKNGRISHAYLLTGPRGVGKTSIARILAHEINGLPYDDEAHLDIIEIDAASNRRIDEIRDLRDKVSTAPSAAKYKVYIIDEVHMLTKEAFNALLKTLEEPPAHVVFILATTEAHKLPETIVSRTQRYTFRPVPMEQVVAHLKSIAKSEKITIDDEALALVAEHGEGSFRDSISLLDQASNVTDTITKADIEQMLGLAPAEQIAGLYHALEAGNKAEVVQTLTPLYASGYEPARVAAQLAETLRGNLLADKLQGNLEPARALTLLERLLDVPAARSPKQLLELVLLETCVQQMAAATPLSASVTVAAPTAASTPPPPPAVTTVAAKPATQPAEALVEPAKVAKAPVAKKAEPVAAAKTVTPSEPPASTAPASAPAASGDTLSEAELKDLWQQTLDDIKKQYNTLYGIARMATPSLEGNNLTISLRFAFHQKRINEVKNRQILSDVFNRLSGRQVELFCVVAEKPAASGRAAPDVAAISNIFGGAELLES